jgi:hypothetical protein
MNIGIDPPAQLTGATLGTTAPALTRLAWIGGLALIVAYCLLFVLLSPLPVQDFPDHLARAVAMNDLLFHGGARFGGIFHFQFEWIPYLLGDLILTAAVAVFGTTGGAALWILLVFLSLPCAALFYLRVRGIDPTSRSLALLLSVYFATDWFFLMGFLSYRVAVAMLIATLALVELLRRKWSYPLFALYTAAVVLDYLMHLSPIVFLLAALGVTGLLRLWLRTTSLRTEVALFVPVLVVLAWHFTIGSHYSEPGDPAQSAYVWGTLQSKFARIGSEFFHFVPRTDVLMVLILAACLFARTGVPRWHDLRRPLVLEMLALVVLFVATYFALPIGYAEAYYVDTRPLPLASFFLIAACLALPRPDPARFPRRERLAFFLAALLAIGNLAYLARHFIAQSAWIAQYRSVVAAIPEHGRVLPVYTHAGDGAVVPYLHVSGYVSMDRAAIEPYVFAADNGNPMKYFRYVHLPYDPAEVWYGEIPRPSLDWAAVARDYDFLVITKPFDPAVFALPTRTVTENSTAVLLAIQK